MYKHVALISFLVVSAIWRINLNTLQKHCGGKKNIGKKKNDRLKCDLELNKSSRNLVKKHNLERIMDVVLDDEPAVTSKTINGTLFDISKAAAKSTGNRNDSTNGKKPQVFQFLKNRAKKRVSNNPSKAEYPRGPPDPDLHPDQTISLRENCDSLEPEENSRTPTNLNDNDQPTESEDSFHSVKSTNSFQDVLENISMGGKVDFKDPIDGLKILAQNDNLDIGKKLAIVTQLFQKTNYEKESIRLAYNYGLYHVCSLMLEQHQSDDAILVKFLQFFTKIMETAQEKPKYHINKVINSKINQFELFGRFLTLLEYTTPRIPSNTKLASKKSVDDDKDLIETLLKIVKVLGTRERIMELCKLRSFRFYDFIRQYEQLNSDNARDVMVSFSRYFYELSLRTRKYAFSKYKDIAIAELCIKLLRQNNSQSEDPLYALYYILSYMPLTNVKAIFQTNQLEKFLQAIEAECKINGKEELVILAQKIQEFHKSNHLSEQLQRMTIKNEIKDEPKFRANLYTSYIPLENYSIPRQATYRGVFKSITDLPNDFESYDNKFEGKNNIRMQQQPRIANPETNVATFCYNFLFNKPLLEKNGFEVSVMGIEQNPNRNEMAAHVCALLNCQKPGILLIGIKIPSSGSHLIQGIVLDRKQRDNYRVGLDNLIKELSDPYPCFDRFDPPTFNPVSDHPGQDEAYIVIVRINPPKVKDNSVVYRFKGVEYIRRNGDTVKNLIH